MTEVDSDNQKDFKPTINTNHNDPTGSVLIIGGGIAGVQSALDLADSGFRVYLLDRSTSIGGTMAVATTSAPTGAKTVYCSAVFARFIVCLTPSAKPAGLTGGLGSGGTWGRGLNKTQDATAMTTEMMP